MPTADITSQGISGIATKADSGAKLPPLEGPDPGAVLPWLPCTVSLDIPLEHFTIGDLSRLAKGSVLSTACARNGDVPLYVNGQLVGWTELEVIDDRLAVRITEIA
ncbi:MAG TPA: FliM/FliN family flagellar motor C-terminal domain-containing protein [Candidatus Angelobacter sp.]|nr:FliM/FliN family flagellar motor C-terminal domain-containing protein [Candidatus Angelobacter sp.]